MTLLDQLNSASELVNALEQRVDFAMTRRAYLEESVSDLLTRLNQNPRKGKKDPLCDASPYFLSITRLATIKREIDATVELYSKSVPSIADMETRSRGSLPPKVTNAYELTRDIFIFQKAQENHELEYARLVTEYEALLVETNRLRKYVGENTIRAASDDFERFIIIDTQIKEEENLINTIRTDITMAKSRYKSTMRKLEEISNTLRGDPLVRLKCPS